MKKILVLLLLSVLAVFTACTLSDPTQPEIKTIKPGELALNKVVFIGNSLTAGFQSAGVVQDFQMNSFPYLIAKQMGKEEYFEQPLIADPGISSTPGVGVLDFVNGSLVPRGTYTDPTALLLNALLPRPYDNLGIPGAELGDALNTVDGSGGNPFFDIVLRNPNFGMMNQVQQAAALNPTLVVLWLGNNDVLGSATSGGDPSLITPVDTFQAQLAATLAEIGKIRDGKVGILMANIPNVTDIPFVNLLDGMIYKTFPGLGDLPVVFDATFQPVDFDTSAAGELYLPLLTEEGVMSGGSPVKHINLPFLSEYSANGLGVPDSAALVPLLIGFGVDPAIAPFQAQALVQGMMAAGLTPSGVPIPGTLTITEEEEAALVAAVNAYNGVLNGVAGAAGIPIIDVNAVLAQLNASGVDGYSGKYVFFDPANTAFSLDGVHPNNAGYAIIANLFIQVLNQFPDVNIPLVDTEQFRGQYVSGSSKTQKFKLTPEAGQMLQRLFPN